MTVKIEPLAGPGIGVDLDPRQELAVLARVLHRIGYDDGLAGHITYRQPDDTVLVNPFALAWDEIRASDVARTDLLGNHLDGPYAINPATTLHYTLHQARSATVVIHNHPRWATTWAAHRRIPPCYDQTGAIFSGRITVVDEYEGSVFDPDIAARVVAVMQDAEIALLAHHGVLLVADTLGVAVSRALMIETRSRNSWQVEALGVAEELAPAIQQSLGEGFTAFTGGAFPNLWEALARREIRRDPSVLDKPSSATARR